MIPPSKPLANSWINSTKNIDAEYPPNADLNSVGFYTQHQDQQRPGPAPSGKKTMAYNDFLFGSFHTGGVNFAYADGRVEFIGDDIDMRVYVSAASRNGGEITVE